MICLTHFNNVNMIEIILLVNSIKKYKNNI